MAVGKHLCPFNPALYPGRHLLSALSRQLFSDAVVSGFMIRNVVDRQAAFREQHVSRSRVVLVICLETTPPSNATIGPLVQFYVFNILPILGTLISGDGDAYRYLPQSTWQFAAHCIARLMEQAGLINVFYREKNFGTVAIHVGTKIGG